MQYHAVPCGTMPYHERNRVGVPCAGMDYSWATMQATGGCVRLHAYLYLPRRDILNRAQIVLDYLKILWHGSGTVPTQ